VATAEVAMAEVGSVAAAGAVLFAYDGSELAAFAIEQAGRELATGRQALVLCVWQPADVGFVLPAEREQHFDADQASVVQKAAEEVAGRGATLADKAGFRSRSLAVEASPTWKGIAETATEHGVGLIVMGSHRRRGLERYLLGSVTAAVVAHFEASVLVVHPPSGLPAR
jgi:nucleotide-binding universal stress UspA family protein